MATLTIRLPDAQRDRLAAMAARRGVSLNKLMQEFAARGLAVLDELDRLHGSAGDRAPPSPDPSRKREGRR